jgi:prepilin-type N-terminal cleavage/methylation domain-containing protein
MNRKQKHFTREKPTQRGFTLIEMLLVLLVATILLVVSIPRIRTVSKERGIRETARVVGSMISKASDEATINGSAGIVIRRNRNFISESQWYASTKLGILRAVPPYVGDQPYARGAFPTRGANRVSATAVHIPMPIEQDENPPVVAGDKISLNHSPVQFEIKEVTAETVDSGRSVLRLELDANPGSYPSIAPAFQDVPFVIHRQPVLRQSSLEELPGGYIIDLRFSGFDTVFPEVVEEADPPFQNYEIELIFNQHGYVVNLVYRELNFDNIRTGRSIKSIPGKPIYFLVTEIPNSAEQSPLANSLSMWVAVKLQSTNPFVGYNIPQPEKTVAKIKARGIDDVVRNARGMAISGAAP